jgi:predicted transposase YdaD
LWTATDVLMGLRYPRTLVAQLLQGVHGMKESVTYQAIVEEGRVDGRVETRQEDILRLGRKRLGRPSAATQAALRDIQDADRLARILDEVYTASSWKELLATP